MNRYQIAKRLSSALLNTVDISRFPKIIEEIKAFSSIIDRDKKLKVLFASQVFSEEERSKALKELLPHLKISTETKKFFTFIITKGYLNTIKEIIKIATEMYNEKLKKVKALVMSPFPLSDNYIERLKTNLKTMTQKDVDVESQIDTTLIGGFVIKVGSTIYDNSLKGQLNLLKTTLTS